MKKKDQINPTKSDTNALEDQEILKFAEEVLSSSDDEILGIDDETIDSSTEDEDVLDLKDLSAHELDQDDDILDLTEELQEADDGEDGVLTLEDITGERASTEQAILDLDNAVDELIVKEEIQNLDESASVPDEVEEESIDLDSMFGDSEAEEESVEKLSEELTGDGSTGETNGPKDEIGDLLDANFSDEGEESTEDSDEHDFGEVGSSEETIPEVEDDTVEIGLQGNDSFDSDAASEDKAQTPVLTKEDNGIGEEELSLEIEDDEPQQNNKADQIDSDELNFDDILELDESGNEAEEVIPELDASANDPHATLDLSDFSSRLEEEPGEEEKALSKELEPLISAAKEPEAIFDDDDLSDLFEEQADESTSAVDDSTIDLSDTPELSVDDDFFAEPPEAPEQETQDAAAAKELSLGDLEKPESDSVDSGAEDLIDTLTVDEPQEPERTDVATAMVSDDEEASIDLEQPDELLEGAAEDHTGEDLKPPQESDLIPDTFTVDQLDQAVERVVKKVLTDKIDAILVDAIEQAVTKRIDRLKSLILQDIDKSE